MSDWRSNGYGFGNRNGRYPLNESDYASSQGYGNRPSEFGPKQGQKVPRHIADRVRNIAEKFSKNRVIIDGIWYTIDQRGWVSRA